MAEIETVAFLISFLALKVCTKAVPACLVSMGAQIHFARRFIKKSSCIIILKGPGPVNSIAEKNGECKGLIKKSRTSAKMLYKLTKICYTE
jgi:hypothetical protein